MLERITEELPPTDYVKSQLHESRVTDQLGTLGGGNHFLEVVHCDRDDQVWSLLREAATLGIGWRSITMRWRRRCYERKEWRPTN